MAQRPMLSGTQIDLAREYYKTSLGRWYHPGDHPAFAGYIGFGRLADGRWYVTSAINEARGDWVFDEEKYAGLAVVELQMLRDRDRWEEWPPD